MSRLRKYGLVQEDYDFMFYEQGGMCKLCGFKAKFRNLSVDHDHKTLKVRGLLCSECNLGLGKFKDDPAVLREAARYLEAYGSVLV